MTDIINLLTTSYDDQDGGVGNCPVIQNVIGGSYSFSENFSSFSLKLKQIVSLGYEESDYSSRARLPPSSGANDWLAFTLNLPVLEVKPFESEYFGDGGEDQPYQNKVTVYYNMIGRDVDSSGIVYRTWVVSGYPDQDGSRYTGPKDGSSPLVDISINATWEVSQ